MSTLSATANQPPSLGRYVGGHGPTLSPLAFVGEAPGLNETIYRQPFIGEAGEEFNRMLLDAGLHRNNHYVTNVFKHQPPDNKVAFFFTVRSADDACLDLPPYKTRLFLRDEFRREVDGLVGELVGVGAKVVVALGATALWALLGESKISSFVGVAAAPTTSRPFWVVPTYHPAAVLRHWSYRPTVVAGFAKALAVLKEHGNGQSKPVDDFTITINPTLEMVQAFAELAFLAPEMSVDVETKYGQIRTISFSLDPNSAFVIPFWEPPARSYWSSLEAEVAAWAAVERALSGSGTKVFHNCAYDIQILLRGHGIAVRGKIEDTMVAFHAQEPELPKGLGSLAARFLHMPEWKTKREDPGDATE